MKSNERPTAYCGQCGHLVVIEDGHVEPCDLEVALPRDGNGRLTFARAVSVKFACGHPGKAIVMTLWALRELWQWTGKDPRGWSWIDEEIACATLDGHTAPAWRRALARKAPAR